MTKKKMYITGGIGATHLGEAFSFPYDLPNDTAYACLLYTSIEGSLVPGQSVGAIQPKE